MKRPHERWVVLEFRIYSQVKTGLLVEEDATGVYRDSEEGDRAVNSADGKPGASARVAECIRRVSVARGTGLAMR